MAEKFAYLLVSYIIFCIALVLTLKTHVGLSRDRHAQPCFLLLCSITNALVTTNSLGVFPQGVSCSAGVCGATGSLLM